MADKSINDYNKFDGTEYLKEFYGEKYMYMRHFMLRCNHEVFKSLPSGLNVLEYGSGPSVYLTISAATKASKIVLSDYGELNRNILRRWLDNESGAYDWSPFFRYVVQDLEGKGADLEEVMERQALVRKLVEDVVPCDVTRDPPIHASYDREYDVVISSLCVCCASQNEEEYCRNYSNLSKLVKPGGTLMSLDLEAERCETEVYTVGNDQFVSLGIKSSLAEKAFKEAGFTDVSIQRCEFSARLKAKHSGKTAFLLIQGKKA